MSAITEVLQPQMLGPSIDTYRQLYDQRKKFNAESKEITKTLTDMEKAIIACSDELGLNRACGQYGQIRIESKVFPHVTDWDALYSHIKDNDAWYLLERSVAIGAFRELIAAGEVIPGVDSYTKRSVVSSAL
jgi:hypothetical protein